MGVTWEGDRETKRSSDWNISLKPVESVCVYEYLGHIALLLTVVSDERLSFWLTEQIVRDKGLAGWTWSQIKIEAEGEE